MEIQSIQLTSIIQMSSSSLSTKSKIQNSQSNVLIQDGSESLQIQRQAIYISKQKLIQLVNKNQFIDTVLHLNAKGKQAIQDGKIDVAIIYLTEAQKILQYAASSGKNINRSLIVSVLHNQACCYQVTWDLPKCSNYTEALIFNFNSELKYIQNGSNPASQIQMSYLQPAQSFKISLCTTNKKMQLTKYYLLFCAINSQLKNNPGALIAAKKASASITQIFTELKHFESTIQGLSDVFQQNNLSQITNLRESIQTKDAELLREAVRYYMKIFRSKSLFVNQSIQSTIKKFKEFSIGNIMQLEPIMNSLEFDNNFSSSEDSKLQFQINHQKITQKLLILSICYFTIATELRYIAISKASNQKTTDLWTFPQFKQSQIFHLKAIAIIAMYIPFNIIYMDHILNSYTNHYKISVQTNQAVEHTLSQISKFKNVLFVTQEQKKCSTTNQSLIVSFQKQDQSVQLQKNMFNQYYYVKDQNTSRNNLLMQTNLEKKINQKKYDHSKKSMMFKQIRNIDKLKKSKVHKLKSKTKSKSKQVKIKKIAKENDDVFKSTPSSIFSKISTVCSPNNLQNKLAKQKGNSQIKSTFSDSHKNQYFVFQNDKMKTIKQAENKIKKMNKKVQQKETIKQRSSNDKKLRKSVSKENYRSGSSKSFTKNCQPKFKQNKLASNLHNRVNKKKTQRSSSKRKTQRSSRKTQKSDIYRYYY